MEMFKKLSFIFSRHDKRFFGVMIIISIVVSTVETVGIASFMPFIAVATNYDMIHEKEYLKYVYELFQFDSPMHFVVVLGCSLIVFYIFRSALNIFNVYLIQKFTQGRFYVTSTRLFRRYVKTNLKEFRSKNSGDLIRVITAETSFMVSMVNSILMLIAETWVFAMLYGWLLWMDWQITLTLTGVVALFAATVVRKLLKVVKVKGVAKVKATEGFYRVLNETLGNFKILKTLRAEEFVRDKFSKACKKMAFIQISSETLQSIPKVLLETMGFSVLTLIVIWVLYSQKDPSKVLPIVSSFAIAFFRMLPALTRIITYVQRVAFQGASLNLVNEYFQMPEESIEDNPVHLGNVLAVSNVSFSYGNKHILRDVDLQIKQGEAIAFVGESGAGKSTLVDILGGLHSPSSGHVLIDDVKLESSNMGAWRRKIGYIPQDVYLFDGTVAENVVLNREFDEVQVIKALKAANVYEELQEKQGLNTLTGENGSLLSGGQKQRVAIARALYNDPEVLILDEATSALDAHNEDVIMSEIFDAAKGKTLLIVAHRLKTIENCNRVIRVQDGKLVVER